jgi:hypothetical protein
LQLDEQYFCFQRLRRTTCLHSWHVRLPIFMAIEIILPFYCSSVKSIYKLFPLILRAPTRSHEAV